VHYSYSVIFTNKQTQKEIGKNSKESKHHTLT